MAVPTAAIYKATANGYFNLVKVIFISNSCNLYQAPCRGRRGGKVLYPPFIFFAVFFLLIGLVLSLFGLPDWSALISEFSGIPGTGHSKNGNASAGRAAEPWSIIIAGINGTFEFTPPDDCWLMSGLLGNSGISGAVGSGISVLLPAASSCSVCFGNSIAAGADGSGMPGVSNGNNGN